MFIDGQNDLNAWIDRRLALSGAAIMRKMGENIE